MLGSEQAIGERKQGSQTGSYGGPRAPSTLLINQEQNLPWVVEATRQPAFDCAPLVKSDPRGDKPKDRRNRRAALRTNFTQSLHAVPFPTSGPGI